MLGPQFGGSGAAPADLSVVFVNAAAAAADSDIIATRRRRVAVRGTRDIGLGTMHCGNDRLGAVEVSADAGRVTFDGEVVTTLAVESVPLSRLYFL